MSYFVLLGKKENNKIRGNVYFQLNYDSEEAIIGLQDKLDDFHTILRADSELIYKNNRFEHRKNKRDIWYYIEDYTEEKQTKVYKSYRSKYHCEFPAGDLDDLLDYYAVGMGFVNFLEFLEVYNDHQAFKTTSKKSK